MDSVGKTAREVSLLRLPRVIERTGKSRAAIYAEMEDGTFPSNVKIGPRAVAWPSDAIDQWVESVIDSAALGRDHEVVNGLPTVLCSAGLGV